MPPGGIEPTISAGERPLWPAMTEECWLDCRQCVPRRVGIIRVVLCVLNDFLCTGLKTKSISYRKFCRTFPDVKFSCLPKQPSRGSGSVLGKNKLWERHVLRNIIWNKVIYFEWDIFRELLYHIWGIRNIWFCFVVEGLRQKVCRGCLQYWRQINFYMKGNKPTNAHQ
jgi:hypothetical protein